jgi:hypothetical protein
MPLAVSSREEACVILRIALTATRVPADDHRVRYDYHGRAVIPEVLVLRRWKDRGKRPSALAKGEVFDGCRLHPQIWSTLQACVDAGLRLDKTLTPESLRSAMEKVKLQGIRTGPLRCDGYVVLIHHLRLRRQLGAVMQRQRDSASPGVPDLFLWRQQDDQRPYGCGFVEVKRRFRDQQGRWRREAVSSTQREEIAFLQQLGLPARTVYLSE